MLRSSNILALMTLMPFVATICGCMSAVKVPEDAQLVWYGKPPVNLSGIPTVKGEGQAYLYDDTRGKVVSVMPFSDKSQLNYTGLKDDHDYALYYVPIYGTPSLTAKPATHPAQ